jgi:hypothetical protein
MTCPKIIKNAHPMPSPELIHPDPPLPDSRVVTPQDLKTYMQQYTEQLLGPLGAWMTDAEMAWNSVFRNTVGPLFIEDDSTSDYEGFVRDPEMGSVQSAINAINIAIGDLEDEIETITTVIDGIVDDVEELEEQAEAAESCCSELTDRIEALEAAAGIATECCEVDVPGTLTATISGTDTDLDGVPVTITYDGGEGKWIGEGEVCGYTLYIEFGCSEMGDSFNGLMCLYGEAMTPVCVACDTVFSGETFTCESFSFTSDTFSVSTVPGCTCDIYSPSSSGIVTITG